MLHPEVPLGCEETQHVVCVAAVVIIKVRILRILFSCRVHFGKRVLRLALIDQYVRRQSIAIRGAGTTGDRLLCRVRGLLKLSPVQVDKTQL